jgi:hypothetical protein
MVLNRGGTATTFAPMSPTMATSNWEILQTFTASQFVWIDFTWLRMIAAASLSVSKKPEELMKMIDDVCGRHSTAYVITHEWAAQLYSPFLSTISQVKCRIFPNAPISVIANALNAREVDEGSNLAVIESESIRDMLFKQEIRGLRVESPILAYLDLLVGEGRAKEMAAHLGRERIGF